MRNKAEVALDELCLTCSKKPSKGFESVMKASIEPTPVQGEISLVQAREVSNLDQSCCSGAGS